MRSRFLFLLLICSALVWGAMTVWCPRSRQTWLFYNAGAELFSDFSMPRACAQAADPYEEPSVSPQDRCYALIGYRIAAAFPAETKTGGALFTAFGALAFVSALGVFLAVKRGSDWWVLPAVMLSAPFVYNIERANQIWIAVAGVLLFLAWHEAESKWKKGVALLALALASALKITPGVFSLLLLKERRGRDFLLFVFAGAVLTLVPFVLWGELGMVGEWLARMGDHAQYYREGKTWGVARLLWAPARMMVRLIGTQPSVCGFGQAVDCLIGGMSLYCFLRASDRRDEAFSLAVVAVVLPSVSQYYTLLYFVPALALAGTGSLSRVEAVLWLLLLTPVQPIVWKYSLNPMFANAVLLSLVAYRFARVIGKEPVVRCNGQPSVR